MEAPNLGWLLTYAINAHIKRWEHFCQLSWRCLSCFLITCSNMAGSNNRYSMCWPMKRPKHSLIFWRFTIKLSCTVLLYSGRYIFIFSSHWMEMRLIRTYKRFASWKPGYSWFFLFNTVINQLVWFRKQKQKTSGIVLTAEVIMGLMSAVWQSNDFAKGLN